MLEKSTAAMEEGVKGSETFVCILSEGYFQSEYCCNEMRWALENDKPIVSTYKSRVNVGALLNTAPDDFRERIKAIDSIALNADDPDYFEVGMSKITKRLSKLSIAPAAQAPAQKPHAGVSGSYDRTGHETWMATRPSPTSIRVWDACAWALTRIVVFFVRYKKKLAKVHASHNEELDPKKPIPDSINEPGAWHFFISHTQRDGDAKLIATELWAGFKDCFKAECWLDVKLPARDMAAMKEGVRNSDTFICIITNNGGENTSYFSRPMCRQEVMWAVLEKKKIVPVVKTDDKSRIGEFIAEASKYANDRQLKWEDPDTVELAWPNFGALNFVEFDRGSDLMTRASLAGIIRQHKGNNKDGDKALTNQHGSPSGARKNSAKPGSTTIEA